MIKNEYYDRLSATLNATGAIDVDDFGKVIYIEHGELIKIFRPRFKNNNGLKYLDGDVGFFLSRPRDKVGLIQKIVRPSTLTACPLMNFPDIIKESSPDNEVCSSIFIDKLKGIINKIPNSLSDVNIALGSDFMQKNALDRIFLFANFLKENRDHELILQQ